MCGWVVSISVGRSTTSETSGSSDMAAFPCSASILPSEAGDVADHKRATAEQGAWPVFEDDEGCGIVKRVTSLRGPLALRRMTAHWVVLAAAALTTLVAATVGAAFAAFAGQA